MIQSHYVPSERPYRIIYTGGVVGLQIGTLIVVDDQKYEGAPPSRFGNRAFQHFGYLGIKTHSYPVVSYVNKAKARQYSIVSDIALGQQVFSESVVWNNVETEDVATICLENQEIPWEDLLIIIEPFVNKSTEIDTAREMMTQIYKIIARILSLGGRISLPKDLKRKENGNVFIYNVDIKLDYSIYKEEEKVIHSFESLFSDVFPFYAPDGLDSYGILDYQRRMYERIIRLIDNNRNSVLKIHFSIEPDSFGAENQDLKEIIDKLNSRNK